MMLHLRLVLLLAFAAAAAAQAQTTCPTASLLWSDEFDGDALDPNFWTPQVGDGCDQNLCGWGNAEAEFYRAENAAVEGGALRITARREAFSSSQYTSARIRSLGKVDLDLSSPSSDAPLRVEASIQLPAGQGLWPAFWMLPSDTSQLWPSGGEIDIMEFIGREPKNVHGYMHFGQLWNDNDQRGGALKLPDEPHNGFHTFAVEINEDEIAWLFDGYEYQRYTADEVNRGKFRWPFVQTFHLILNLAVGGNWPGYPDDATPFPATMLVDFVRVYEGTLGRIEGPTLVHSNDADVEYCVTGIDGDSSSLTWSLPGGASITSQQGPSCVSVEFGADSGYVEAEVTNGCGTRLFRVPVEVQPYYSKEFTMVSPQGTDDEASLVSATGSYETTVTMDSQPVVRYVRKGDETYDHILFETSAIADPSPYLSEAKKMSMDLRKTTAAPCTRIFLQFEDSAVATPDNYPVGRSLRLIAYVEDTIEWQRLEFGAYDQPDRTATAVDRVVLLIDPTMHRSDEYFIRNWDSTAPGCAENCEPLSTNTCRAYAKSEAGACGDGINNDWFGYDGDAPTDCDDSDCWNDPVCGRLAPSVSASSSPAPTGRPAGSPTTQPTKSPIQSDEAASPTPVPVPSLPTAAPFYAEPTTESSPVTAAPYEEPDADSSDDESSGGNNRTAIVNNDDNSSGGSTGIVIGAVVSVVLVIAAGGCLYIVFHRRRKRSEAGETKGVVTAMSCGGAGGPIIEVKLTSVEDGSSESISVISS